MDPLNLIKSLLLFVIVLLSALFFFSYDKAERSAAAGDEVCEEPLTYRIGTIDSRFGITKNELEDAMNEAVSLWSDVTGRPLAVYSDKGDITVEVIYDERQQLVEGERRFKEKIKSEQIRTEMLQNEYDRKLKAFEIRSDEYKKLAEQVAHQRNELDKWVKEINDAGGFEQSEIGEFEQRKRSLRIKQEQLMNEKQELEQLAADVNSDVEKLNQSIDENNRLIDRYNNDFSGESRFAKATYRWAGKRGVITVNQFLTRQELPLILAHEFGHAVGLGHGTDPESVMHSQMGGQMLFPEIQLTSEDKAAIRDFCR
jgi:predicted Zn-dependent protease